MRLVGLILLAGYAGAAGCSGGAGDDSDERAILDVMDRGRDALVKGDGAAACRLLTPHARRRALGFQVDFLEEGTPVPSKDPRAPQTCEQVVRAEFRREHLPAVNPSWIPDLNRAKFTVAGIAKERHEAKVVLRVPKPYGPEVSFRLRQDPGAGEWRIHDSDGVPSGY